MPVHGHEPRGGWRDQHLLWRHDKIITHGMLNGNKVTLVGVEPNKVGLLKTGQSILLTKSTPRMHLVNNKPKIHLAGAEVVGLGVVNVDGEVEKTHTAHRLPAGRFMLTKLPEPESGRSLVSIGQEMKAAIVKIKSGTKLNEVFVIE